MISMRALPALTILIVSLDASYAFSEYLRVDVEKVPVDRLVKNLEEAIRKDPKDAPAVHNLARAHAMAYSLRSEEVEVDPTYPNQVWFGYQGGGVPFRKVFHTDDPEKLKVAKAHLEAALKLYGELMKLTPDDVIAELGHAWLLTQTEKKSDAIAALRKVIEKCRGTGNSKDLAAWRRPFCAVEAGNYLLPLLDPENDKAEILALRARAEDALKLPRGVTPIAIPMFPGLTAANLEDRSARVAFDADGSGRRREWTWITREAAWLVHDPKRTGKITSGLQLFGNVTFWMFWDTGYDALAALDDNHDGQLTGSELDGLALWQDLNGDGICDPGEVKPVSEFGIVAISCKCERDPAHPDRIAYSPTGVTFKDGTTRATFDLVLHSRQPSISK
jgi:hypothetical protein